MAGFRNSFGALKDADLADFENSHSSKDLRKKEKLKPKDLRKMEKLKQKLENLTLQGDIEEAYYNPRSGESISRLGQGKPSSGFGVKPVKIRRHHTKSALKVNWSQGIQQSSSQMLFFKKEVGDLMFTQYEEVSSQPYEKEYLEKVSSQPNEKENLEHLENKVSRKPKSQSKRMHAVALVDMVLSKIESSQELKRESKKMSRHEENLLILKKILKVRQEKEDNNEGIFFATSFPSRNDVNGVEKKVKQMATTLAMVTLREWMFGWKDLESLAKCENKTHIYNGFQDSVFKGLAKFILSIFDTEDLERHNFFNKLDAENKRFYCENLLDLEGDDDPIKLIAEGKITFDGFPSLTEPDIGFLMQRYNVDVMLCSKKISFVPVELMSFGLEEVEGGCFKKRRHKCYVEMARTVMLQYAPLKEEIKMHTFIENIFGQCYCTIDALRCEALCDIGILDMKMNLTFTDLEDTLEEVAWRINCSMSVVSMCIYDSFSSISTAVTYALQYGPFGLFTSEVIDLVKIAEGRRRYEGHRYINKHHILWAIGLTEIKGFVDKLIDGIGLQNFIEEPATYPPYNIYMAARSIANMFGDEFVCIEHLVVAIVFEMNQRKLNGKVDVSLLLVAHGSAWIEFESKKCVQAFLKVVRRLKWKSDRYLVKIPTKIVPWPVPEVKVMDELRRLKRYMRYGWHEFSGLRCNSI